MQALCLSDKLAYTKDHPKPRPEPGEALIRVIVAGICGSDLEVLRGYHEFQGVLGHEFVGVVEEAADETWVGRRVVAEINCGDELDARHAPDRRVLGLLGHDGAFAEYVVVPEANLHAVPDEVTDEAAVFCEPLAAALRLREQVLVSPTDRMAVVGPGRLGLLIGQVLTLDGGQVTMLGHRPGSLDLPIKFGFAADLAAYMPDDSFDLVIDATGDPGGLAEAIRLARPLGTVALKSTFAEAAELNLSPVVVKELTLVGSRCGPFEPALRLLARQQVDVLPMIDAEYPLKDGLKAFQHAAMPGALKVLLRP